MNNNYHFNRYVPSFRHGMGLEHDESTFNSYYSSMNNNATSNNNQNLFRHYENENSNNNAVYDGGSAAHSGNRNVLAGSSDCSTDLNQKISARLHFPDVNLSHYPQFHNANFLPQLFQQNNNVTNPNIHNRRHLPPPSDPFSFYLSEDDTRSMYGIDVERSPLTSPDLILNSPSAPTFPNDLSTKSIRHQQRFDPESSHIHQNPLFPIRPVPQTAHMMEPTQKVHFICSECGRYCSSSGGLKRHVKFCRVIRAKLKNEDAKNLEESKSPYYAPYSVDIRPLNLSSDSKITRTVTQNASADIMPIQCEPINFSVNNVSTGSLSFKENNNVIQSQSISTTPTISKITMPTLLLTVPSIPEEQIPIVPSIKSVTNGWIRKCPQCPRILQSEEDLVKHLVSHNIHKPYECTICGSRFSRKFPMTRHMKQCGCDGSPKYKFQCEICGKHFSRKDNMNEHVKVHMGQTKQKIKLPCPVPLCEKTFSSKSALQVHLNLHFGSRPYNCNYDNCDKTFRSIVALRRHLFIHNHGKPFQCPECDACFGDKYSLSRHIHGHNLKNKTKYICSYCGKDFVYRMLLDDHVKAHKTFKCEICDRTYKHHWRLQKHYKQIHYGNLGDESNPIVLDSILPNVEKSQVTKFNKRHALKAHHVTHVKTMKKMNTGTLPDESVSSVTKDAESQDVMDAMVGEIIDVNVLEGNIIELLSILVDVDVMRNFCWPNYSVDMMLQSVLVKCGKEPLTLPHISLAQRLRSNIQILFSFLVDDQTVLDNLFSHRSVEQVLQQVIALAKSNG